MTATPTKQDGRVGGAVSVKPVQSSTALVPVTSRTNEGGSGATSADHLGVTYTLEVTRIVDGRTIKSTRRVGQFVAATEVTVEFNKPGTVLALSLQAAAQPSQAKPKETAA